MGELFFLEFRTNESVDMQIEEPIGYDGIDFTITQDTDRYGRDKKFAGLNYDFEFTEHCHGLAFYKLVEYFEKYGFEGDVRLRIIVGNEVFYGNLDYMTCLYNGDDSIKLALTEQISEILIKNRKNIKVDMFSVLNVDKEPTDPAPTQNILIRSKEEFQESEWEFTGPESPKQIVALPFNYIQQQVKTDIKDSLTWFGGTANSFDPEYIQQSTFKVINSKTDIRNVTIVVDLKNSILKWRTTNPNSNNLIFQLVVVVGNDPNNSSSWQSNEIYIKELISFTNSPNKDYTFGQYTFEVPLVRTGQGVWVYLFPANINYSSSTSVFPTFTTKQGATINIKTFSSTYDTIVNSVSVYDAVKKIAKDTANIDVVFPLAQTGALKSNYIFNGNLLRGKKDKPFNVSFEDIKNWFPELNLDYEVLSEDYDSNIYIGNYKEFYTDNEIDVFPDIAIQEFTISANQNFGINKFSYRYDTYQSQKEITEEGTIDNVHGEAEYHVNNKQAINEKSVSVGFVRDPFVMEAQRRIALTETDDTATQDDSTIFILDTQAAKFPEDYFKVYTGNLFHSIEGNPATMDMRLILRNSGDFRWDLLGLEAPNGTFQIQSGANVGDYIIEELSSTQLKLRPSYAPPSNPQSGEFYTKYSFILRIASFSLVNFTYNNGLALISGIKSPTTYSNLRFTLKTNIDRYWKTWLATANLYGQNDIENVEYKNNPEFRNNLVIPAVDEGGPILTKGINGQTGLPNATPILSQHVIETKLIMPFEQFIRTTRLLRSPSRGYIRTFDVKGNAKYVYPTEMKAIHKASNLKEVTVKGELKYMPNEVNITKTNGMYNVWIHKLNELNFTQDGDYIQFKDGNGLNIYQRSNLFNTKVNGQQFLTIEQLVSALNAL